jgi:hypothetical protein
MAGEEVIDPQYSCWYNHTKVRIPILTYTGILPEHFELSPEAARYAVLSPLPQFLAVEGIYGCVKHLAGLGSKQLMIIHCRDNSFEDHTMIEWKHSVSARGYTSLSHFRQQQGCFEVLRSIGLDVHSGPSTLGRTLRRVGSQSSKALPMS